MNTHRMDQETVERLLVGPVADPLDGPEAIVRLLTAVRVAPRPHELHGEQAAVQAFRMARAGLLDVAASRPQPRVLAGLLTAKVALTALLVAATGGVALAAATGTLPDALGGGGDGSVSPTATVDGQRSPTGGPGTSPTRAVGTSGTPSASAAVVGLCTAYQAEASQNRGRALESPKFAELVATAGGREKVPGYCDRLLEDRNGQGGPAATDRPDDDPTGRDSGRSQHSPSTPAAPEGERPTAPSADQPAPVGPTSR